MGRNRLLPRGKKIKPAFFVFCEGETEEQYVKFLRSQYRISIIINSKIAGNRITESYIKHYKKTKFTHQKDKDFLIYDLDAPKILERLQTIDNATLLVSNPCIELWFLLHFKEQKAAIDCKACVKEIINKNGAYKKGILNAEMKEILTVRQLKARHRAKKMVSYNNPSSKVYLLIEELERVKKEVI